MTDSHLLFVSVSALKEPHMGKVDRAVAPDVHLKSAVLAPSLKARTRWGLMFK